MNLVGIAGVPPCQDMSGKLVGIGGCGCQGMGTGDAPTDEQRAAFHSVALIMGGIAVVGLLWMYRSDVLKGGYRW